MSAGSAEVALALALSIGSVAYTASSAKISAPARTWLVKKIKKRPPKGSLSERPEPYGFVSWLYQLVSCPYCLSHWLAFGATAVYRPFVVHVLWPVDFMVTAMAMVSVAMLPVLIIKKALK